jgi:NADH dehydrogenase (ubiquinone) Fe-S protein 3
LFVFVIRKWIYYFERSEHGNRYGTKTDYLFQFLCFLKLHSVQVSIDSCGVDYPSQKQRFEVSIIYWVLGITHILIQTTAGEVTRISLVVNLFSSVGWWERKNWDMFGVSSINQTWGGSKATTKLRWKSLDLLRLWF